VWGRERGRRKRKKRKVSTEAFSLEGLKLKLGKMGISL